MDKIKYLSRIQLFTGLELEQLRKLEPITPANLWKKKTTIASPYTPRNCLFLIKSGTVRLYRISSSGKELTVDLLGSGHIFGEIGSFTTGTENVYAETIEDSTICTLDKDRFESIVMERPELGLKFIEIISLRLREVEEMLELIAYGSVRKRLLYLLYKLSRKFGRQLDADPGWLQLDVRITHQELASMAGSIRETVTEQLRRMIIEGVIGKAGSRSPFRVHPERLLRALEEID